MAPAELPPIPPFSVERQKFAMCPSIEIRFREAPGPSSVEPHPASGTDPAGKLFRVSPRPVVGVEYLVVAQAHELSRTLATVRLEFSAQLRFGERGWYKQDLGIRTANELSKLFGDRRVSWE
jgi:hypothetical protein